MIYHLKKTPSKELREKIVKIEEIVSGLKGVQIRYTKKRIVFMTTFQFMTLFVNQKGIYIMIKVKSWSAYKVYQHTPLDKICEILPEAHKLSKSPILKNVNLSIINVTGVACTIVG